MEVQGVLVDPGIEVRGEVVDLGMEVRGEVVDPGMEVQGAPVEPGMEVQGAPVEPGIEVRGEVVDLGMEVRGEVVDPGTEVQEEVVEQLENLVMGPGGQRAADQENMLAPAEGGGEAQLPLPQAAGPPGAGVEVQGEVMEQLENVVVGPCGQRAADPEKVPGHAEGAGEAQVPLPPDAGMQMQGQVMEQLEMQGEVMEQLDNVAMGQRAADPAKVPAPAEGAGEAQALLPQDAGSSDAGMEVQEEVMDQLEDLAMGPGGQRAADLEKVQGHAEGGGEAQAPLPLTAGPPGAGMDVQVTEQLENVAVAPGEQRTAHQENVPAPAEGAGEGQAPLPPAAGSPGAGMDVQGEVVEQLENLAVGPGGQRAAEQEKVPAPAEGGEAHAPLPPAAGPPGAGMEMQVEVMEQLENLAVGPGGQRAAHQENVLAPAEGAGEARVPLPPAAGPPRSPPPAWPGSPSTAVSSSDSESDTDSDSSSTLFSSSSALSDEDDFPNEKDDRPYCIRTKDEVPIDKLPPVEDLTIILPDNVELKLFGTVSSIIEQLVIIESLRGLPPVNEESIIFKEDRQAVGKVFEIFGPVSHPFYVMRFNNSEHIKEKGINVQDSMYFAPSVEDFTQYIFAEKLKQEKGSDASWKNDQEPPFEVLDFSDDEKEREAKLKKKKPQSQGRKKVRSETLPSSENQELNHSVQQPAPSYSRGYRGRGFSWGRFPPPSGPQGFFRPAVRPPQLYSSDRRVYQESPMFPPPPRRENPMMQQYAFPPPDFGYASNGHQFSPPPSNMHMMWTGPNMYNSSYSFLPPPPPPPPPESYPPPFRPY